MNDKNRNSRRRVLRGAIGLTALSAAAPIFAAITPAQVEGPFFPVRSQPDTDADMTVIAGHSERALLVVDFRPAVEDGGPRLGTFDIRRRAA